MFSPAGGDPGYNLWSVTSNISSQVTLPTLTWSQGNGDPREHRRKDSPVKASFRTLKVSMMGVLMPAMVPIMLPSPRLISIKKNITDQKGDAGK